MFTLQDLNWIKDKIDHTPMRDKTLVEMKDDYNRYLAVSEKLALLLDDHPVDEEKEEKKEAAKKKAPAKKTTAKK